MIRIVCTGATALAVIALAPTAASAAGPSVSVSPTSLSAGKTTLSLHGAGFQSIPKGFGGIYVLFGTVRGTWRPSRGGTSGGANGYDYVPDSQTVGNAGYQKFVSFPGGSTEAEANGGVMTAAGEWATSLVVPGPTFTAASGATVDCRVVTCGVITIGAHGVVNGNNETFSPVHFAATASSKPATRTSPAKPTPARTTPAKAAPGKAAPTSHDGTQAGTFASDAATTPTLGATATLVTPSSTTAAASGDPFGGVTVQNGLVVPGQLPTPSTSAVAETTHRQTAPTWPWFVGAVALLIGCTTALRLRRRRAAS